LTAAPMAFPWRLAEVTGPPSRHGTGCDGTANRHGSPDQASRLRRRRRSVSGGNLRAERLHLGCGPPGPVSRPADPRFAVGLAVAQTGTWPSVRGHALDQQLLRTVF